MILECTTLASKSFYMKLVVDAKSG